MGEAALLEASVFSRAIPVCSLLPTAEYDLLNHSIRAVTSRYVTAALHPSA
jgi:hypothetical protein